MAKFRTNVIDLCQEFRLQLQIKEATTGVYSLQRDSTVQGRLTISSQAFDDLVQGAYNYRAFFRAAMNLRDAVNVRVEPRLRESLEAAYIDSLDRAIRWEATLAHIAKDEIKKRR